MYRVDEKGGGGGGGGGRPPPPNPPPPPMPLKTICKCSFFEKSKMTLQEWLMLIYWWAREHRVKDAAQEVEVDKNTRCDVHCVR